MKDLLGGKGAGLAEMTNLGVPVPAGFTISTEACVAYFKNKRKFPLGLWEEVLKEKKAEARAVHDTDLAAAALKGLVAHYKRIVKEETGHEFPDDPNEQLKMGINAVFNSWYGARAVTYRRLYDIPDSWGTAVNVVAMVFGNLGETSGTGVAFTRDPGTRL